MLGTGRDCLTLSPCHLFYFLYETSPSQVCRLMFVRYKNTRNTGKNKNNVRAFQGETKQLPKENCSSFLLFLSLPASPQCKSAPLEKALQDVVFPSHIRQQCADFLLQRQRVTWQPYCSSVSHGSFCLHWLSKYRKTYHLPEKKPHWNTTGHE